MKLSKGAITAEALPQLRDELLKAKHRRHRVAGPVQRPPPDHRRRRPGAGGRVPGLGLQKLLVSKAAMREGILYDIVGRASENDPRDESVAALSQRYGIDTPRPRVEPPRCAVRAGARWKLDADDARMLGWAARLHELGLMIAHSGYHVHGSYVLEHSDIAGFSRQEQQMLAALVRSHRRSVPKTAFDALPERLLLTARRLALLRLAVLLNRAHEDDPLPALELTADDNRLSLIVPQDFIDARPLLRADLIGETDGIAGLGIQFRPFVA
jgi:exopolyphosphatase/guanosine-5'-triphosphate,3'-diphosphate pyrophosphatase